MTRIVQGEGRKRKGRKKKMERKGKERHPEQENHLQNRSRKVVIATDVCAMQRR
jgi:hypothetical protein